MCCTRLFRFQLGFLCFCQFFSWLTPVCLSWVLFFMCFLLVVVTLVICSQYQCSWMPGKTCLCNDRNDLLCFMCARGWTGLCAVVPWHNYPLHLSWRDPWKQNFEPDNPLHVINGVAPGTALVQQWVTGYASTCRLRSLYTLITLTYFLTWCVSNEDVVDAHWQPIISGCFCLISLLVSVNINPNTEQSTWMSTIHSFFSFLDLIPSVCPYTSIRDFLSRHYINWHFTYLLGYHFSPIWTTWPKLDSFLHICFNYAKLDVQLFFYAHIFFFFLVANS